MANPTASAVVATVLLFWEDTEGEHRVWVTFLYHAGLSYQRVEEEMVGYSHKAVYRCYLLLGHLFRPRPHHHEAIAADEYKVEKIKYTSGRLLTSTASICCT